MAELVGSRGARQDAAGPAAQAQGARDVQATWNAPADWHVRRRLVPRPESARGGRVIAATEHLAGGLPVVSVVGEVDLATAAAFEQTLLDFAESQTGEVIVDLTGCSFFDSRGLRALIATRTRLESAQRAMALVVSRPAVLRVFRLTGYDEQFTIYPSLGAAVEGHGRDRV